MNQQDLDEIFDFVLQLTYKCGETVRKGIQNVGKIETKTSYHDLVTKYDGEIEEILIKGIKEKYKDHCFIGEETSSNEKKIPDLTDAPTWIIDPIDGTINFCKALPMTCISIALAVEKQIVLGLVYMPCTDEMYTAKRGKGAFLNGNPIHVSKETDMKKSLIAHEVSIASFPPVREKVLEKTREYVLRSLGIRCFGSAAYTLCLVARGNVEAFHIEELWPWDIAAGSIIIQEAGGIVIASNGGPYDIMRPDVITACTQEICDSMLAVAREVDERIQSKTDKK